MSARSPHFGKPPYGQHFLHDLNLLELIVRTAELHPSQPVVEIGCGTGRLTRAILETGASLTGVEVDSGLARRLRDELGGEERFRLVEGDVLRLDWKELLPAGGRAVVMGNLPYAASTEIFFRALEHRSRVERAVFLVQWEVARRMAADPGGKEFGVLSVACQLYGKPVVVRKVPPGVFLPPPKVDSALVRWDISPEPLYPFRDHSHLMALVRAAFGQRRKTLLNSLGRAGYGGGKEGLLPLLEELGIPGSIRPERLAISQFVQLSNRLLEDPP